MEKSMFAAKLKAWRKRENLSQSQAATRLELAGVTLDSLQNWESARSMPRGSGLIAILNVIQPSGFVPRLVPKPDPRRAAALTMLKVLKRYAEDNNLKPVAKQVDEIVRLLK